jgi:transcriptional regulator with XRE-family HTH domain
MIIGDLLIDMRKQSGKTQQQIADKIGVNVKTLRDYEQGVSNISGVKLFKVASFCRYDLTSIVKSFSNFREWTMVKKGHSKGFAHTQLRFT